MGDANLKEPQTTEMKDLKDMLVKRIFKEKPFDNKRTFQIWNFCLDWKFT